jgi:twitching motility protein PilT
MPYANPIDPFLEAVLACGGSDLHLVPGALPRVRCHGRIAPVRRDESHGIGELRADELRTLILGTMPAHLRARWEAEREMDYSYDGGEALGRFRVNAYFEQRGPAAVFRRVPPPPASMDEVGLPAAVQGLVDLPNGLVLLVGPTGAGKSTTMAAMVNEVNERRAGKILTVEDPVEFAYRERGCVISQREVGADSTRSPGIRSPRRAATRSRERLGVRVESDTVIAMMNARLAIMKLYPCERNAAELVDHDTHHAVAR